MSWLRRVRVVLAWGLWLAAIAIGLGALERYRTTPGAAAAPVAQLPTASRCQAAAGERLLVLFLHPHCPCGRATLAELSEVLAAQPERLRVEIHFVRPPGAVPFWEQTALWE